MTLISNNKEFDTEARVITLISWGVVETCPILSQGNKWGQSKNPINGVRVKIRPVAADRRRLSGPSPTQSKLADYYLVARHARDNQEDIVAVDAP